MAPISKDLPVRQFPPKPELVDTYKQAKKQAKRRIEPAANSESWREQAPQPQDLDPTPSVYERPEELAAPATPAAPQAQTPSTPAPTVSPAAKSPAATSPAPPTPPPLEAPPLPVLAPPPP